MSDGDDDFDYTSTNQSSGNLATIFHGGPPASSTAAATAAYVPPKQPKKDSSPRVMIASVVQTFSFGADQKWVPKGKMGVALLSTDNTIFQLIIYLSKTQQITSARITTSSVFTPQSNNYLSFQDDGGQNWSIMFDTKQGIADFALQIVLAKAYLFSFKFDHIIQDIREGEGSLLVDQDSVEITVNTYKFLENGTIQATDSGESKPVRFKIGKQQNGKTFDDVLRGMKKNSQRVTMIGTIIYNIEIVRIKREKDARSGSITMPTEEHLSAEQKRPVADDHENDQEKNKMLERIKHKMGGRSMIPNQSSAFAAPLPPHLSDDDSINNEYIQHVHPTRSIPTPAPPVQFVQAGYHYPQGLIQQPNLYSPQQQPPMPLHDYNVRPGSSMAGMPYQQAAMWPQSQYPPVTPQVPPPDMYYQQPPPFQPDFRQLLNRLNEKVDGLNEKLDAKNSTTYPNMETSILLANIQRIVKENESVKKDLFDRSAKVEELNSKISDLLNRNQKLIEQSHLTAEQRMESVTNVSEQTAQKILELEKQKVELTNNLSASTSKIADLQLQLNQYTQNTNENQSHLTSLKQKSDQYKEELQKSESQRLEIHTRFETIQEHYKNEKLTRKQLQNSLNTLEEELAEVKANCANLEKTANERKTKNDNERKRWQDDLEEQKQGYEKELDELRVKLRKQRTTDNLTNNQEFTRIEQEVAKEWQQKLDRQETQHERSIASKGREIEQIKALLDQNEAKLLQTIEELNESKLQTETYKEGYEKLQERLSLMKEKLIEMNDEQPQLINEQVKQAMNIIFQRLKTRIRPSKKYTGEEFLSRALEVIKKVTLKILSNNEDEEEEEDDDDDEELSEDEVQSEVENDQPTNGNSVDQQTLHEEVSSVQTEESKSSESETLATGNVQKNGWDTVDDLQQETNPPLETPEQNQVVDLAEDSTTTTTVIESETIVSDPVIESNEPVPSSQTAKEEEPESDESADTIEENDEKPPPVLDLPKEKTASDDEDDDALFQSARPSIQDNSSSPSVTQASAFSKPRISQKNIPLLAADDSDDELFK